MCERSAAVLVENEVCTTGRVSDMPGRLSHTAHSSHPAPLIPLLSPLQVHNNAHAGVWASSAAHIELWRNLLHHGLSEGVVVEEVGTTTTHCHRFPCLLYTSPSPRD